MTFGEALAINRREGEPNVAAGSLCLPEQAIRELWPIQAVRSRKLHGMPFDKMAGNAVQRCHELHDLTTMQLLDGLGPMVGCWATVVGPGDPYRRRSMVCLPRSSEIGPVGAKDYFLLRRLPRPAGLAPIRNASRLRP